MENGRWSSDCGELVKLWLKETSETAFRILGRDRWNETYFSRTVQIRIRSGFQSIKKY